MQIEKILTENPYVDELIYNVKILAYGCILKNENKALENETLKSKRDADMYMSALDGVFRYDLTIFKFKTKRDADVFISSLGILATDPNYDKMLINNNDGSFTVDKSYIPSDMQTKALQRYMDYIIENYEEYNNYYRMLNGKPDIDQNGKLLNAIPIDISWNTTDIGDAIYIHQLDESNISNLESTGVLNSLRSQYPEYKYLDFIGTKKIDIYKARKANKFEALYIPDIDSGEIFDKFRTRLNINRLYTIRTIYSEAFKYGSDYYDEFISILIVIQTMVDVLSEIQEFIARKEIFDLRSIRFMFQSYGIPFYSDIPLKYQVAMAKNINKLIKYKSTSKNMIDICTLFGFENIDIFKYYLLRDRKTNEDGSFMFNTKEVQDDEGNTITVEDNDANYDLKFVKVPLQDNVDNYIKDPINYLDYDSTTEADPYWAGSDDDGTEAERIKSELLNSEFTYVRTKYISIDTMYDMSTMSFEMAYFFNAVFALTANGEELCNKLKLSLPFLGAEDSRLTDVFCYLFALISIYNNMDDIIIDTVSKAMHVNGYVQGFNMKANIGDLISDLKQNSDSSARLSELINRVGQFKTSIPSTYQEFISLFNTNKSIRTFVVEQMMAADNKRIYDIYKWIYDSLMTIEYNYDFYKIDESEETTFTDFLENRDSALCASLKEIKAMSDEDSEKSQYIAYVVNNIIYALDEFKFSDEFRYIYNGLPTISADHVKQYIAKVIDFFKSYKIDMLGIDTIYIFNDKLDNTVKINDGIEYNSVHDRADITNTIDLANDIRTHTTYSDNIMPSDKIYMSSYSE